MKKKAIVLLSGGLDSAVTLWWAQKKGYSCHAISFDYQQRHKKELKQARFLAHLAKVPHHVIRLSLPWSQSTLTTKRGVLPHHSLKEIQKLKIPSTYVPGRNTLFLSYALSCADAIGATSIAIGANALDYSGYPDCRPVYLNAFSRVATLGSKQGTEGEKPIRILAPLLHYTKAQIIVLGRKLDVPLDQTWSCYEGGKTPCGQCDSCVLRIKGMKEASQGYSI